MPSTTTSPEQGRPDSSTVALLPEDARPPKSKTEAYYAIHPSWQDVEPIPLVELENPATYAGSTLSDSAANTLANAGPALASIAYTPRYTEAMSYLRAVMANEEYSKRALGLTEDIINMNPAHYTVWIYRFRILKELWGISSSKPKPGDGEQRNLSEKTKQGLLTELQWLERMSEKHLKNYQIWHHRTSLFQLLPTNPAPSSAQWVTTLLDSEPAFLRRILESDTKNYHVWSYRQWLCAHFHPQFITNDNKRELGEMNDMIDEDPMNNSAWNHRYFILFGYRSVLAMKAKSATPQEQSISSYTAEADVVDLEMVESELAWVRDQIRSFPQNGSSWNYLKGVLHISGPPPFDLKTFCGEFVGKNFDFGVQTSDSVGAEAEAEAGAETPRGVRSSQAIEMLVEIFAEEAKDAVKLEVERSYAKVKVQEGLHSLGEKWDPIRRRYWDWKLKGFEHEWDE